MAQRIVGLDLGSYSVKAVHVEPRGRAGEFEVVAYDEELVPTHALDDEGEETTEITDRHRAALSALAERGMLKGDRFVTGLPGDAAAVRTLTFPFDDPRKIQQALPFELEAEIPFDVEDLVISWAVLRTTKGADGADVTEVLCAYARREAVKDHLDLLAEFSVDPRHVEFDALALDDLYDGVFKSFEMDGEVPQHTPGGTFIETGPDAPEPGTAMIDIGHRRTSVCILEGDRVVSAQTILHGGADATRLLARELGLPLDEAERGKKKEAFIEVLGARAQFPEQQRVSDLLKKAYQPIARRLRQVFQASLSSSRVRVTRVILTGGGSRVLNLDRHLSETLNIKVERAPEIAQLLGSQTPMPEGADVSVGQAEAPQAGLAIAFALSALLGDKSRARIDFRTGEFAWKGELDFLRERIPALAAWAGVLVLALSMSGAVRGWMLKADESDVREQQVAACKAITGQTIESTSRCLAIIQERINGQAGVTLPEFSAVDHYLEVSKRMPPKGTLSRKVTELDINSERVRLQATVDDFDGVDKVVAALGEGRCFESAEKGKARNVKDGVEFDVLLRVDCEKKPGDADDEEELEPASATRSTPRPPRATSSSDARRKAAQERAKAAAERRRAAADKARERAKEQAGDDGDEAEEDDGDKPAVRGRDADEARKKRLEELRQRREALRRARGAAPLPGGPAARNPRRATPDIGARGVRPLSRPPMGPSDDGDDEGEEE